MQINDIRNVIKGNLLEIESNAKAMLFSEKSTNPLIPAFAFIIHSSGYESVTMSYKNISHSEQRMLFVLLDSSLLTVAHRILELQPDIKSEILNNKSITKALKSRPMNKLPEEERMTFALKTLLTSSSYFFKLQKKYSMLNSIDIQIPIIIYYGWRRVVTAKRGHLESVKELTKDAWIMLNRCLKQAPQNPLLNSLKHKFIVSWKGHHHFVKANSASELQRLSSIEGETEDAQLTKLLCLRTLLRLWNLFKEQASNKRGWQATLQNSKCQPERLFR